jgi:tripeptide aminopeptidase
MNTSGDTSFHYIAEYEGTPSKALVRCAPRAFDSEQSEAMVAVIERLAEDAAHLYKVKVEVSDELVCVNTRSAIETRKDLLDIGVFAHEKRRYSIELVNVRAGTDGAMINMTYPGLPAPNMGNGSRNIHSTEEFVVVEEMESVVGIILDMVQGYTQIQN